MMFSALHVTEMFGLGDRQIRAGSNLETVHIDSTIEAIKLDKIA